MCQDDAKMILDEKENSASSLSVSPDGRWVAVGGSGSVHVWNVVNGTHHATLLTEDVGPLQPENANQQRVSLSPNGLAAAALLPRVIFSPQGNKLYAATMDGSIRSWRVPEFVETELVGHHGSQVMSMAISPDDRWLVVLGNVGLPNVNIDVTIWDLEKRELKTRLDCGESGDHGAVAISHEGPFLGIGLNPRLLLLNLETLKELRSIEGVSSRRALAFSPDGAFVASATGLSSPTINVHRVADGKLVARLEKHTDGIRDLAYSPDGKRLASASADQTVRLWDTENYQQLSKFKGHLNEVRSLAFSADGSRVITGGKTGEICVWNIATDEEDKWPTTAQFVVREGFWYRQHSQISFSPDSRLLAATRYLERDNPRLGFTLLWPEDLRIARVFCDDELQRGVRFSPVRNLIAVGDVKGRLAFVQLETPNDLERITVQKQSEVFPIRFTPDGQYLLVIARGKELTSCVVYSVDTRSEHARWTIPQGENCAVISPDGVHIAIGYEDGIRIWRMNGPGVSPRHIPIKSPRGMDFSPNGRVLVAGTGNGVIEVIDFETGMVERKLAGHTQHIGDVKFSPDGKRLASAGTFYNALKVWDVDSGRELANFNAAVGYGFSNRQVEWSPCGDSILLMGGNGDVTIWRVPTLEQIERNNKGRRNLRPDL